MVQQSTINTATVYALRSYFCLEDGFDISGPNMLWLATKPRHTTIFVVVACSVIKYIVQIICSLFL